MITYERGCLHIVARAFYCRGSVFPTSLCIALPCSILTAALKWIIDEGWLPSLKQDGSLSILRDNSAWSGFVFLVGFLIVFRTSQAYARFWDGCTSMHRMRAEWFDACAALIAFCRHSKAEEQTIHNFQHILVRLFSMLHAVALADVEDSNSDEVSEVAAFKYELVDAGALDEETLEAVRKSPAKVELVFQWIQQLIVENIDSGILTIPAPILSRAFQEIANGMVAFHEALKISSIPFPFPYAQTCELLLMFHWLCTPIVLSQYASTPFWGGFFSFLSVFIYWSLNFIAIEIENPFGMDANDIDASDMQAELNMHLVLLLDPATKRTPTLSMDIVDAGRSPNAVSTCQASLSEIWRTLPLHSERSSDSIEAARRVGTPEKERVARCNPCFCCCGCSKRISATPAYDSESSWEPSLSANAMRRVATPEGPRAGSCHFFACCRRRRTSAKGRPTPPPLGVVIRRASVSDPRSSRTSRNATASETMDAYRPDSTRSTRPDSTRSSRQSFANENMASCATADTTRDSALHVQDDGHETASVAACSSFSSTEEGVQSAGFREHHVVLDISIGHQSLEAEMDDGMAPVGGGLGTAAPMRKTTNHAPGADMIKVLRGMW